MHAFNFVCRNYRQAEYFFQFSLTRSQDEVSLPGTSTATWSFVELLTAVLKLVTDTDSQDGCVGVILYLLNE